MTLFVFWSAVKRMASSSGIARPTSASGLRESELPVNATRSRSDEGVCMEGIVVRVVDRFPDCVRTEPIMGRVPRLLPQAHDAFHTDILIGESPLWRAV